MIKLTTKGRQHLFGSTDFTDETDIKYMFFDTSVTSTNVESICENWTHSSTNLSKLASPSKQTFNNLRYGFSGNSSSSYYDLRLLSDSSPLTQNFTKDTGGYAAVINNTNECLGYIKVMTASASVINSINGPEQSWDDMIVSELELIFTYRADYISLLFSGDIALSDLRFRVVSMHSSSFNGSNGLGLLTYHGSAPTQSFWDGECQTLSNDVPISNLRLEGNKLVFDDQFIDFTATGSHPYVYVAVVAKDPSNQLTGPLCFLTPNIDSANGGVYISCGPDGLFQFV